jgi:hypothetical protein
MQEMMQAFIRASLSQNPLLFDVREVKVQVRQRLRDQNQDDRFTRICRSVDPRDANTETQDPFLSLSRRDTDFLEDSSRGMTRKKREIEPSSVVLSLFLDRPLFLSLCGRCFVRDIILPFGLSFS